jgi:hypothetical protein
MEEQGVSASLWSGSSPAHCVANNRQKSNYDANAFVEFPKTDQSAIRHQEST